MDDESNLMQQICVRPKNFGISLKILSRKSKNKTISAKATIHIFFLWTPQGADFTWGLKVDYDHSHALSIAWVADEEN